MDIFVGDCCLRSRNVGERTRVRWRPDFSTNRRYFCRWCYRSGRQAQTQAPGCQQVVCFVVRNQNLIFPFSLPDLLGGRHIVQSCTLRCKVYDRLGSHTQKGKPQSVVPRTMSGREFGVHADMRSIKQICVWPGFYETVHGDLIQGKNWWSFCSDLVLLGNLNVRWNTVFVFWLCLVTL